MIRSYFQALNIPSRKIEYSNLALNLVVKSIYAGMDSLYDEVQAPEQQTTDKILER